MSEHDASVDSTGPDGEGSRRTPAAPEAGRGAALTEALRAISGDRSSCERPDDGPPALDRSRVLRFDGMAWDGVRARPYKTDSDRFRGVTRRVLAAPETTSFEMRYFEIESDGYSTHERHEHAHVVLCLRGCGEVRLGGDLQRVGYGDVVYVAPNEPHQFRNPHEEPFGFLCIVDRERDRPVPVRQEDDRAIT